MSPDERIELLLDQWEESKERGTSLSADELCHDQPELLEELKRRIRRLEVFDRFIDSTLEGDAQSDDEVSFVDIQAGRYRAKRLHKPGGLGEVYYADDEELNREVALKRLRPSIAWNRDARARFLLEAEMTGRLEHPGVVPIYGLGKDDHGHPYYAMRFIRGKTLDQACDEFYVAHGPNNDAGKRARAFQSLLHAFVTVCKTVAYVHSHSVLHRDIKPNNILLGDYGEVLVVDWGLAKVFNETEIDSSDVASESERQVQKERPTCDTVAAPAGQTMLGEVKGTPAYMSPEQACGKGHRPATDIYSLGATLYKVLTGQIPFAGESMSVVLKKVRNGEFVPPRAVNPLVPPALEAICLKAMQKEPDQRYRTASALADDVELWLADEPVTAWREPWTIQLRCWFRKHRTLVSTGVTAVILSVVLLTGFAARLGAENSKLSAANALITAERDKAEWNLEFAYQQISDVANVILDSDMALKPKSNSFRDMCEALLPYLDKLAEMARDTPFREEAASQREIVRLSLELNQNISEKDEDFVRSINAFRLAAEKHRQPAWKNIFLGLSYVFEAQRDQRLGKRDEARTQFFTAFELFRKNADTETVAGRKAIELGTVAVIFIRSITDKQNPSAWQAFLNCRDLMLDAMSEIEPNARNISGLERLVCQKVFLELQRVSETPSDSIAIRLAADSAMQVLQTIPESWRHHYAFQRARAAATYYLSMMLLQDGKQKEAWDGMCRASDYTEAAFESTCGTFADFDEVDRRFVIDCELVVAMLGREYILALQKSNAVDHATIRTMANRSISAISRIQLLENAVAIEFREPLMDATLQPAVRFFEELQRELRANAQTVSPTDKP